MKSVIPGVHSQLSAAFTHTYTRTHTPENEVQLRFQDKPNQAESEAEEDAGVTSQSKSNGGRDNGMAAIGNQA
jgi:hypothetical protein